jgi:hypothetical protein
VAYPLSMRSFAYALASLSSLFVALAAGEAAAAPPAPAPAQAPSRSSTQFTLRREEAGGADVAAARGRARAGDCAGALPQFDAAIAKTIEPTLRRDRGLCHEKENHPYPAIDDYRAYLTARPDASDAEQIRERLARLEEQTGQGGRSSQAAKQDANEASMDASAGGGSASASVSIGGSSSGGAKPSRAARDTPQGTKDYDDYVAQEKLAESADTSPLRYGEGWVLGPYVNIPQYFFDKTFTSDMAYALGGRLGYSFSPSAMFVAELGYAGFGEGGKNTSASGPQVFMGAELRVPISRYGSDQILLGGGLGFERYVVSGTRAGIDMIPARFKLGYRHVFGSSLALDIAADGGPAYALPDGGGDGKMIAKAGASFALLVAF